MSFEQPILNTSPEVSDEIRKTTCYMCACRCGINVHLKQGKVAYIEGNRDHPVNKRRHRRVSKAHEVAQPRGEGSDARRPGDAQTFVAVRAQPE